MQDEERKDDVQEPEGQEPEAPEPETPEPDAPDADAEAPGPEIEGAEEMAAAAEEAPEGEAGEAEAQPEERKPEPKKKGKKDDKKEEVIPGAHLEPDLVLEEERAREAAIPEAVPTDEAPAEEPAAEGEPAEEVEAEPEPAPRKAMDLAADARYQATGKRKTAVARVILKPGSGTYQVNGRALDQFFPRIRLQRIAKQPLETAGYQAQMDVVAKIHGGGVSAQAGALRHGIARALVEADPALRVELKRRGFLTRDPREKERKKAGLKKARKRPQFSKR
jgi:small subunit ribosomal protein S9